MVVVGGVVVGGVTSSAATVVVGATVVAGAAVVTGASVVAGAVVVAGDAVVAGAAVSDVLVVDVEPHAVPMTRALAARAVWIRRVGFMPFKRRIEPGSCTNRDGGEHSGSPAASNPP
jgi:tetrahydrodipicolinate N-succinyltransferase